MSTESRNDVEKILLHTRDVSSKGYIRTDGLFIIEGTIIDKKSYDIPKSDGTILKEGEKSRQSREALKNNQPNPFPEKNGKPALLNTCFAFDERSEVTEKQWPNYFKKD